MTKCGMENPNYRHGEYCGVFDNSVFEVAMAKDLLVRVLNAPINHRGDAPFTKEESAWAFRVVRERPEWARDTLRSLGFSDE